MFVILSPLGKHTTLNECWLSNNPPLEKGKLRLGVALHEMNNSFQLRLNSYIIILGDLFFKSSSQQSYFFKFDMLYFWPNEP
jgi:hypothetical protein